MGIFNRVFGQNRGKNGKNPYHQNSLKADDDKIIENNSDDNLNKDEKYWREKAEYFYKWGEYGESLLCSEKAISLNPMSPSALIAKVNVLIELNQLNDAFNCIKLALKIDPKNSLAIKIRNELNEELTEYVNEFEQLKTGFDKGKIDKSTCEDLADLLFSIGEFTEALEYYTELKVNEDYDLRIWWRMGDSWKYLAILEKDEIHLEMSKVCYQAVNQKCEEVLVKEPDDITVLFLNICALEGIEEYEQAINQCNIAINSNQNEDDLWLGSIYLMKARICKKLGLHDEADECFKKS